MIRLEYYLQVGRIKREGARSVSTLWKLDTLLGLIPSPRLAMANNFELTHLMAMCTAVEDNAPTVEVYDMLYRLLTGAVFALCQFLVLSQIVH